MLIRETQWDRFRLARQTSTLAAGGAKMSSTQYWPNYDRYDLVTFIRLPIMLIWETQWDRFRVARETPTLATGGGKMSGMQYWLNCA